MLIHNTVVGDDYVNLTVLEIVVEDNGVGLDEKILRQINDGFKEESETKRGIGLRNAVTRLHMYYGNAGKVRAKTASPTGTRIEVTIPYVEKLD